MVTFFVAVRANANFRGERINAWLDRGKFIKFFFSFPFLKQSCVMFFGSLKSYIKYTGMSLGD